MSITCHQCTADQCPIIPDHLTLHKKGSLAGLCHSFPARTSPLHGSTGLVGLSSLFSLNSSQRKSDNILLHAVPIMQKLSSFYCFRWPLLPQEMYLAEIQLNNITSSLLFFFCISPFSSLREHRRIFKAVFNIAPCDFINRGKV